MIHEAEGQGWRRTGINHGGVPLLGFLACSPPSDRRTVYARAVACGCGKKKQQPIARRGFTASAGSTDPNKPNAIDRAARIKADKQRRLNGA